MYDTGGVRRVHVTLTPDLAFTIELRARIVEALVHHAEPQKPLEPFTVARAHEVMANRDLNFKALLVHDDFVPLLVKARRAWCGHKLEVFSHFEVPFAHVYGLADPEFLGVVSRKPGTVGIGITNQRGIVWGMFREVT